MILVTANFNVLDAKYPTISTKLKRAIEEGMAVVIKWPIKGFLRLDVYGKVYQDEDAIPQIAYLFSKPEDFEALSRPYAPKVRSMRMMQEATWNANIDQKDVVSSESMIGGRYETDPGAFYYNNLGRTVRREPFSGAFQMDDETNQLRKHDYYMPDPYNLDHPFQALSGLQKLRQAANFNNVTWTERHLH